jgi:hypothetical protein
MKKPAALFWRGVGFSMFVSNPPYQDHQLQADTPAQAAGLKALFIKQKTSLVFLTDDGFSSLSRNSQNRIISRLGNHASGPLDSFL